MDMAVATSSTLCSGYVAEGQRRANETKCGETACCWAEQKVSVQVYILVLVTHGDDCNPGIDFSLYKWL
jgi:hypothetical protein